MPGVQYVAAGVQSRTQVVAGNQNWFTRIQGTDVDLPLIRAWPTRLGAFFSPQDVTGAAKVAVLGNDGQRRSCSARTPIRSARSSASAISRSRSSA